VTFDAVGGNGAASGAQVEGNLPAGSVVLGVTVEPLLAWLWIGGLLLGSARRCRSCVDARVRRWTREAIGDDHLAVGARRPWIAFSALLATRHPVDATDAPSPLLGKLAPALKGHELGGGTFSLKSERGKIVVVNFWASVVRALYPRGPGALDVRVARSQPGVVVVGVVFDDTVSSATNFARTTARSIPRSSTPVAPSPTVTGSSHHRPRS